MSRLVVFLALFVAVLSAPIDDHTSLVVEDDSLSAPPNLTEIVRLYMNFGAPAGNATHYDCRSWAQLWNEDGIRNTPGMPPSTGWDKLEQMCQLVRSQFSLMYCDSALEIDVRSYSAEKRTAFRWTINGILASTGEQVVIPAISALFMDKDGTIQNAWDWLDPSPIHLPHTYMDPTTTIEVAEPVNITEIVRVYMNFGGFPNYPHAANCSQWAGLFDDIGIRNTPGIPPTRGFDNLVRKCESVRGGFETMLNFAQDVIPVMSWNAEKRVAFTWSIEGLLKTGEVIHRPAITALFLFKNGTIQYAWDFLDPTDLPDKAYW